jgi:hypothetical protein
MPRAAPVYTEDEVTVVLQMISDGIYRSICHASSDTEISRKALMRAPIKTAREQRRSSLEEHWAENVNVAEKKRQDADKVADKEHEVVKAAHTVTWDTAKAAAGSARKAAKLQREEKKHKKEEVATVWKAEGVARKVAGMR